MFIRPRLPDTLLLPTALVFIVLAMRTTAPAAAQTSVAHIESADGTRLLQLNEDGGFAVGFDAEASNDYAIAIGPIATADGWNTIALGYNTTSDGIGSVALGSSTTASSMYSTAMGRLTTASGARSTAMGDGTTASGSYSTAMGHATTASGFRATAMGFHTIAASNNSLSIGQFNSANTSEDDTRLVVGNGTSSSARSDALVLDATGNLTIAGTLTESSDARLKEAIRPLRENVLGRLGHIRPVRFRFRDERMHPAGEQIGLIAQEVQAQFPELVSEGASGYLSVSYSKFTAVLLKGLQEQHDRVSTLEGRLARLEAQRKTRWSLAGVPGWLLGLLFGGLLGSFFARLRHG